MTDGTKEPMQSSTPSTVPGSFAQVFHFDGKGGVTAAEGKWLAAGPQAKGFTLIMGSQGSAEFRSWLASVIGASEAESMIAGAGRTRCQIHDDKALVVLRIARRDAQPEKVDRQLAALWIEHGRIILATDINVSEVLGLPTQMQTHSAAVTPFDFAARLALRAIDRLEPLVERMNDNLDNIEESLIQDGLRDSRGRLGGLRRTLIGFRRFIWPLRDVLSTLEHAQLSFLTRRDQSRLRETADRAARLVDELQALSERAGLVHEQILDQRAEQTNRAMLVLAAFATVFMPLTLLTGLLGMNVAGIPYANHPAAFAAIVAFLLVLAIGQIIWFRRRHWL